MEHRINEKDESSEFLSDIRGFSASLDFKLDILICNLIKIQIT